MGLRKGMTNNAKGRTPGKPTIATSEAKAIVNAIIKQNFTLTKVKKDLKLLEPNERLQVLTRLLQFTLPRPTETSLHLDDPISDFLSELTQLATFNL
jgi:hypothetical protein